MKKYIRTLLIVFVLCFSSLAEAQEKAEKPFVIMISFDGFRHDYVEIYDAPHFKSFIAGGVAAKSMTPSFPSKTFPNHYTLVTGLYPDHHGLVDNSFYDSELDLQYSIGNRERVENPAFYGGLPLWQLVQRNGMKSASYFWVGSEAPVAGNFPDYYTIYDGSVPNEDRIDQTINWLKLPKSERPNFVTLYFSLVDSQGHSTGPDHPRTEESVLEADRLLGLLKAQADQLDLPVNIIVVSDHGMEPVYPKKENYLDVSSIKEKLEGTDIRMVNNGAHVHFYLSKDDDKKELISLLEKNAKHYRVYRKSDLPKHLNYGSHDRIGDVMIIMEPGHYISSDSRIKNNLENQITRGEHGFDPYATEHLGAIFYANGPNFKKGLKIEKFENVHVYPMIAELLGIKKYPKVDGKRSVLKGILKK